MQRLYQAGDRIEAQFLVDFLDRHLIEAAVFGDYLAGAFGELPVNIYPTVWVLEDEDLSRAEELLARFLAQTESASTEDFPWICPGCGERVEAGFDLCWNCGRARE
jgi:hypothetical protein